MGKVFDTLSQIGATSESTKTLFRTGTRDRNDVKVWLDKQSGVIFIDDFYVGDSEYEDGNFRDTDEPAAYEELIDTDRRLNDYQQYYVGKRICDVGCGAGTFLKRVAETSRNVAAVELQVGFREKLNKLGIDCKVSIENHEKTFDSIFMFHSLEHFVDPVYILECARKSLSDGGRLIVEVPHARDFLISTLQSKSFIDFTLWSQHLILHTRESLRTLLKHSGFSKVSIEGIQRYPLSNHLHWLTDHSPGGHKTVLSSIDTEELRCSYENALQKIDATDTLVAIAEV